MIEQPELNKRLRYTLTKPTKFEGHVYKQEDIDAGVELELNEEQALDLLDQGVIYQPED